MTGAGLRSPFCPTTVPAWIVSVKAPPLTPNGKLDSRPSPRPSLLRATRSCAPEPCDETERLLLNICDLFPGREIGLLDDFFALGRPLAAGCQAACAGRAALAAPPIATLLREPTIARLAAALRRAMHACAHLAARCHHSAGRGQHFRFCSLPGRGHSRRHASRPGSLPCQFRSNACPRIRRLWRDPGQSGGAETFTDALRAAADRLLPELKATIPQGPIIWGSLDRRRGRAGGRTAPAGRRRESRPAGLFRCLWAELSERAARCGVAGAHAEFLHGRTVLAKIAYVSSKLGRRLRGVTWGTIPASTGHNRVLGTSFQSHLRNIGRYPGRITLFRPAIHARAYDCLTTTRPTAGVRWPKAGWKL